MGTDILNGLSSTHLFSLADAQLDGLTSSQLYSLANTQLAGLHSGLLSGMAGTQLDALVCHGFSPLRPTLTNRGKMSHQHWHRGAGGMIGLTSNQ
ncbi:MAG: hypothetical protein H7836_12205 [Magnetococcus sp. YQC-3]